MVPSQIVDPQTGLPADLAGRIVQVPLAVAPVWTEQASQEPSHAESQQKPSEQNVDWHCAFVVHVEPLTSALTHCPCALQ